MTNWTPKNCMVIGASGGLGAAFVEHLEQREDVEHIHAFSRSEAKISSGIKISKGQLDYEDPQSIIDAVSALGEQPLDLVLVATGLLHTDHFGPEKSLKDLNPDQLMKTYLVNTVGPALMAQHFLPLMRREGKSVFAAISARVGSISDNRMGGWYGYRAAKAGLNQILKTASIEHARRWKDGIVVGLHPGTVDTALSKPFQRNVAPGKLFTASHSAAQMLATIDGLTSSQTGQLFAYDGSEISP